MHPYRSLLLVTFAALVGCAPSKTLQLATPRSPLPADCQPQVLKASDALPASYDVLASIDLRDTGATLVCDKSTIRELMRQEACKVGANGILITAEEEPGFWSTCHQSSAKLVWLKSLATK